MLGLALAYAFPHFLVKALRDWQDLHGELPTQLVEYLLSGRAGECASTTSLASLLLPSTLLTHWLVTVQAKRQTRFVGAPASSFNASAVLAMHM